MQVVYNNQLSHSTSSDCYRNDNTIFDRFDLRPRFRHGLGPSPGLVDRQEEKRCIDYRDLEIDLTRIVSTAEKTT